MAEMILQECPHCKKASWVIDPETVIDKAALEAVIAELEAVQSDCNPDKANDYDPLYNDWNRGYFLGRKDGIVEFIIRLTALLPTEES